MLWMDDFGRFRTLRSEVGEGGGVRLAHGEKTFGSRLEAADGVLALYKSDFRSAKAVPSGKRSGAYEAFPRNGNKQKQK
jgi:hypothetical protein